VHVLAELRYSGITNSLNRVYLKIGDVKLPKDRRIVHRGVFPLADASRTRREKLSAHFPPMQ
jgi:hypothetical protein